MDILGAHWLSAFLQVVVIDLTLAGDNAVVIGLAAAGLPARQRGKAILIGILVATVMRIGFSVITTQLLQIVGLLLAGGILLLWVCWKMWRELRRPAHVEIGAETLHAERKHEHYEAQVKEKTLRQAVLQIVIADISMSLDNVLAVAGAAREHAAVLVFGLALSVLLMGLAATLIARLLEKHRWIAYIGLGIILFVAAEMIYRGAQEVLEAPAVEKVIDERLNGVIPGGSAF
ncbi:MAG TPA: TerC family protein [Parvularculaceae bacterium]|nr:TerC family protein [Parvularculaceae bacterium]